MGVRTCPAPTRTETDWKGFPVRASCRTACTQAAHPATVRRTSHRNRSLDPYGTAETAPSTEPEAVAVARARAAQLSSLPAPGTCGLLRWAAATVAARHAVEIGSSAGLTGLSIIDGMEDRGILTSIEADAHVHGLATSAYERGGVSERVRSILGDPGEMLDRLSDGAYELVVLAVPRPGFLDHVLRLLKPGGMLIILHADRAPGFSDAVDEFEDLITAHLPFDGGLVLATVR